MTKQNLPARLEDQVQQRVQEVLPAIPAAIFNHLALKKANIQHDIFISPDQTIHIVSSEITLPVQEFIEETSNYPVYFYKDASADPVSMNLEFVKTASLRDVLKSKNIRDLVFMPIRKALFMAPTKYWEPRPITNLLASAAILGGAGYAIGAIIEALFGDRVFMPGGLRKRLALASSLLSLPLSGLYLYLNKKHMPDKGWLESFFSPGVFGSEEWWKKNVGKSNKPDNLHSASDDISESADSIAEVLMVTDELLRERPQILEYVPELKTAIAKTAQMRDITESPLPTINMGFGASLYDPRIETDRLISDIYDDPVTPPKIQSTVAGIISAAALQRGSFGKRSPLISPADIARVAVGMGSGWVSGRIAGKILGALAGLTPDAREKLQKAGLWAGLVKAVVPLVFK